MTSPMTNTLHKKWYMRYGAAVLAAAAGYWLRLAITRWVGPELPTFITFYPVVMLAALLGGIGPGLLATGTVVLLTAYWLLPPVGSFRILALHDAVGLAFFACMGVFMSVVAGLYRRARGKLEDVLAARTRELDDATLALKQQVELVDPARAEIIAQEMQRMVRERAAHAQPPPPAMDADAFWRVPLVAGTLAACTGVLVLAGWLFGVEAFTRLWPGLVAMKANTAACFVLAGAALLLRNRNAWRQALAAVIGAVGVSTLAEYATGVETGLDQLLFHEVTGVQTAHLGRMAPATALGFVLVAMALLLLRAKGRITRALGPALALAAGITGAVVVIGYLYADRGLYGFGGATSMAVLTAVLFIALAFGLVFARVDGLAGLLMGAGPGAHMARRLLPSALLAPPALGWLFDYGVRRGWYSDPAGTALFALSMMVSFAATILWTARVLAQADAERREMEEHLRNQAGLMDQATDALIVRELNGAIRFWNRGAETIYGWPAAEALGRRIHALLQTEGLPPEYESLLLQHGRWEGELRQTTQQGNRITIESRKTAMRTEGGGVLVLESNRDVSVRRSAEMQAAQLHAKLQKYTAQLEATNASLVSSRRAALNLMEDSVAARERTQQMNQQLVLLQEREKAAATRLARAQSAADTIRAMHEGVILLDPAGTILSVNPAVERLTGMVGETLLGRNIETLLSVFLVGDDLKLAQQGLAAVRVGGLPEFPPLRLKRPGGPSFRILPSVSRLDAADGGPGRTVVLTLTDVTDLHEAVQQMEASERKYRELVENANSMIMRITPVHDILFFNEYAQKFFGYAAAEVLGRNVVGTIVPAVDSEGRDLRAMMRNISEQPDRYASNENENMCKDGRRVWVHWSNQAICDAQGRVTEILCVGTDITARRALEAEARRYQQRLRDLAERLAVSEEQDRWRISRYIHDTVIQNLSLSNIRMGSMVKPLRDANLQAEAAKLDQVRGLLGQAMDECRSVMSDLTPALLYELGMIPALQDLAQKLEAKHGARIIVKSDGREIAVSHTLRGMLFESVRELIINALKHAGPCEIRVTVSAGPGELVLCVADNGKGVSAAAAGAPANRKGGFGLLNIRQRVEGLGGHLEIASAPGKGTTATIRIPVESDGGSPDPNER